MRAYLEEYIILPELRTKLNTYFYFLDPDRKNFYYRPGKRKADFGCIFGYTIEIKNYSNTMYENPTDCHNADLAILVKPYTSNKVCYYMRYLKPGTELRRFFKPLFNCEREIVADVDNNTLWLFKALYDIDKEIEERLREYEENKQQARYDNK